MDDSRVFHQGPIYSSTGKAARVSPHPACLGCRLGEPACLFVSAPQLLQAILLTFITHPGMLVLRCYPEGLNTQGRWSAVRPLGTSGFDSQAELHDPQLDTLFIS